MATTTYLAIISHKILNETKLQKEIKKVKKYKQKENTLSFIGNNLLYHFQMDNLCKTHRKNKKSLFEIFQNEEDIKTLVKQTEQRERTGTLENRIFECWRINNGSITFFKMCNAMYLYQKYKPTRILDMTAGWGGRMLGALALNIPYLGFDTNLNLKKGYDDLITAWAGTSYSEIKFISCLDANLEEVDYDFMMTSPPYEDLEIYENMETYSKPDYYKKFLIPMIEKSRKHINKKTGCGYTAINISPQIYKLLTETYKYEKCLFTEDLKEQKNGKSLDMIYFWN